MICLTESVHVLYRRVYGNQPSIFVTFRQLVVNAAYAVRTQTPQRVELHQTGNIQPSSTHIYKARTCRPIGKWLENRLRASRDVGDDSTHCVYVCLYCGVIALILRLSSSIVYEHRKSTD